LVTLEADNKIFINSQHIHNIMEITKELLEHTATLARLKLSKDEVENFIPQLKEILDFFSKLDEVDTTNVKPSFQAVVLKNETRKDELEDSFSQEDALKNTEHKKDGYFKGPRAV